MTPETPGGGAVRRWPRPTVAILVVIAVAALTTVVGDRSPDTATGAGAGGSSTAVDAATAPLAPVPRAPTARECGRAGTQGPTEPPPGALRVTPSMDLPELAKESPEGTVFWLAPGIHALGSGSYDQVSPRDGQRFLGAPGAVVDGQRRSLYAFGGHATDVEIAHLVIQRFGRRGTTMNEGVVNHDAGHDWTIRDNTVRDNAGAGVFIGSGNVVRRNCLRDNGQYGFSAYEPDGVRDVRLAFNEIVGNNTADWERRRPGCGCTGGGKFWDTRGATVVGNWVHDNHGVGIWADTNNTEFLITRNYIADNDGPGLMYETSYNALITSNVFLRNALEDGRENPGFPTPAIYLSESGADPRAGERYGDVLRVAGNRFVDNWSGVIAFENADRFAGSPANTSSGYTTLVNPEVATEEACADPDLIGTTPYVDDCRWKVQHLMVDHNTFRLTRSHIGPECEPDRGCGYVALISNWGSYPEWSPYQGTVVEEAITHQQDNHFRDNTYLGPWSFMAEELWQTVSWQEWRAAPYGQDAGSSWRG